MADLLAVESFSGTLSATKTFIVDILSKAFVGDPTAVVIIAAIALVLLLIVVKVTPLIYSIVKRLFLILVVFLSLYFFVATFKEKIFAPEPDFLIISVGAIGAIIGFIALLISLFSLHPHVKKISMKEAKELPPKEKPAFESKQLPAAQKQTAEAQAKIAVQPAPAVSLPQQVSGQGFMQQIRSDRSLLAVISYIIIGEFGVFSTITITAPTIGAGIAFFVFFMIGAVIFIKATYHDYRKGLMHLAIASIFGFLLSLALGAIWSTIPIAELLSADYFRTTSLVAFVTGIGISLLMGARD